MKKQNYLIGLIGVCALIGVMFSSLPAQGRYIWEATNSNDWSTGSNWDTGSVPGGGDTPAIKNGLSESARSISSHDYGDGTTPTFTSGWGDQLGGLFVGGLGDGDGRLDIESGANMAVGRNTNDWIGARGSSGEVNQSGGVFYGHTDNNTNGDGEYGGVQVGYSQGGYPASSGVYNLSGGFMSMPVRGSLVVGRTADSTGEFNMSGGQFYSIGGSVTNGGLAIGVENGTGTMNIEGTWSGGSIETGGYMLGTDGGSGTMHLQFDSGGVTPIQSKAGLEDNNNEPSNSVGNVVLGDGAVLDLSFLDSEVYNTWEVMSWDGELLDDSGNNLFDAAQETHLTLADVPMSLSGNVANPENWEVDFYQTGSGYMEVTAVPEPGSLALLLLGAACLFTGRRRHRK